MSIEVYEHVFDPRDPGARRRALFRETPADVLRRWILGTAWALKPCRIRNLPPLARLWARDLLAPDRRLPDPERTVNGAGLCGIVHDLSPDTLLQAYASGLIPFAHCGPLKWLSPAQRCVLATEDFHLEKTARRLLRSGRYTVSFDRDFEGVLQGCAGRRVGRWRLTWITPQVMHAFAALHDAGHAHSVEVWNADGKLVGGSYGLAIGGAFFGESMFSRERNVSKLATAALNWHLAHNGFSLHDGKWMNPLLRGMGFKLVARAQFRARLANALAQPGWNGRWHMQTDLATIAAWQPQEERRPRFAKARALALALLFDIVDGSIAIADALGGLWA